MSESYVSPPGYHRHQCKFCSYVWEHHDCNDVRHGDTGAHECPACHRCNWSLGIYEGGELPRVRNGALPQVTCPRCKGQGFLRVEPDNNDSTVTQPCPECNGTGKVKAA